MAYSFDSLKEGYQKRWNAMKIVRKDAIDTAARSIIRGLPRYQKVAERMGNGMPGAVIGVIHLRESDLNFNAHLHNGDAPLSKPTRHVPRGRGPFASFEDSAVDALAMEGAKTITDWDIPRQSWFLEKFNGFGYQGKSGGNPYLYGGTNQYQSGKFVRDGVYDSSFHDPQLGVMPILKTIYDDRTIKSEIRGASKKLTFLARVKTFVGTLFTGLTVSSFFDATRPILEFVQANGLWFLAGAAVIAYLTYHWLEMQSVEDFKAGNWTPSGLAEKTEDDQFTAKAKTDVDDHTHTELASAPSDPSASTPDTSGVTVNAE